jgi:hypothetical protein
MIKKVWKFLITLSEIRYAYHKRQGLNTWY